MLYLIYCGNHPDMTYRGGQTPIVHLEADLHEVVQSGIQQGRRWAFTLSNAGARYTEFRNDLGQLGEVDWAAVAAADFRDGLVKEGKQAEFLLHEFFPWHLVRRIGVFDATVYGKVANITQGAAHRPAMEVRREWYF